MHKLMNKAGVDCVTTTNCSFLEVSTNRGVDTSCLKTRSSAIRGQARPSFHTFVGVKCKFRRFSTKTYWNLTKSLQKPHRRTNNRQGRLGRDFIIIIIIIIENSLAF